MDDVPDEVILEILKCLLPRAILDFGATCKRILGLCDKYEHVLWERLCTLRWEPWPGIDFESIAQLTTTQSLKRLYIRAEEHAKDNNLSSYELLSNAWLFNFTPAAGGRGLDTLMRAYFAYRHVNGSNKLVLCIPPQFNDLHVTKLAPRRSADEGGCDELFCTCEIPCQCIGIQNFPFIESKGLSVRVSGLSQTST